MFYIRLSNVGNKKKEKVRFLHVHFGILLIEIYETNKNSLDTYLMSKTQARQARTHPHIHVRIMHAISLKQLQMVNTRSDTHTCQHRQMQRRHVKQNTHRHTQTQTHTYTHVTQRHTQSLSQANTCNSKHKL